MIQEPIIIGQNTRYPLKGLLTLPEGDGPFPPWCCSTAPAAAIWMKKSES